MFRFIWLDMAMLLGALAIGLVIGVVVFPLVLPNPARIICAAVWYPLVALGLLVLARKIARRRPTFQQFVVGVLRFWRGGSGLPM